MLLDVILPEGGGIETLRAIKQRYPRLTVILMSGMPDTETARHAERLGAFDYIQKPIDYDELEGRIIAGLDNKQKT
jgi:DNA-binding NtrC family response regulator